MNYIFKPKYSIKLKISYISIILLFMGFIILGLFLTEIIKEVVYIVLIIMFGLLSLLIPIFFIKKIKFYNNYFEINYFMILRKKINYSEIQDIGLFVIRTKNGGIDLNNIENSDELVELFDQIINNKNITIENKQILKDFEYLNIHILSIPISIVLSIIICILLFLIINVKIFNIPIKIAVGFIFGISYILIYYIIKLIKKLRSTSSNSQ